MTNLLTITFDTIIEIESMQDAVSVAGILEAVLEFEGREVRELSNMGVLMDNDTCYSNPMIPVTLPLLVRNRGIAIKR